MKKRNTNTNRKKEDREPKKKPNELLWIILVIFALSAVALYFLYLYLQKPVVATIRMETSEAPVVQEKTREKERFEGKYVSFSRSSSYVERQHEIGKDGDMVMETALFVENALNSRKIALTVEKNGGNYEESSHYKLRESFPGKYAKGSFQLGEVGGLVFSAIGEGSSFEKVFFVKNKGLLVILSISSPDNPSDEKTGKEANEVAGSLIWKK